MQAEKKPAPAAPDKREMGKSLKRAATKSRKAISGYNDIQHFYKSTLKYARTLDKDPDAAYELGYN